MLREACAGSLLGGQGGDGSTARDGGASSRGDEIGREAGDVDDCDAAGSVPVGTGASGSRRSGSMRMLEGASGFGKRSATSSRTCSLVLPRAARISSR